MNFFTDLELGFTNIYTAGLLVFVLAIYFLYKRNKARYLYYFSIFTLFTFAANFIDIIYYHFEYDFLYLFYATFILFEGYYLLRAVHSYFNLEMEDIYLKLLKFLLFLAILSSFSLNRFVIFAPPFLYLAYSFYKSSMIFFEKSYNIFLEFIGFNSFIMGIVILALPYLRSITFFNKYGVFIKGFFALLFIFSVFSIYYEDLQYKLKIREKQYQKLFDQSPAGMMLIDKKARIIKVNNSISEYTGYSKEELEGQSVFENLVPIKFKIRTQQNLKEILNGQDKEYIMETYDKYDNKRYFLMKETKFVMPDYKNCVLSMRIDYTDYKMQQEEIKYLSYHDNLTDLYNRTFMEEEMKRLNNSRSLPIAVIMIDVNGLKLFNDTFGHQKGDQLLIKTADILKKSTRKSDLVARWAGDEFVILLPNYSKDNMKKIVERIKNNCNKTNNDKIMISLAIGYAVKEKAEQDLFDVFEKADQKMYQQKMSQSRKAKKNLINNILSELENKSSEDRSHIQRLKNLSDKFSSYLGLKNEEKIRLIEAAELHDLGKISIPEKILKKEDKLTAEEWSLVKDHPEVGYKIAAASKEFASVGKIILHHHEHWDGNGYPEGLKEEEIPFLSRVISIIDAFDVMKNKNIYSKKMGKKEAVRELKRCSGTQFDPDLIDSFIEFIA